jgi:FxLD family lantipeptide
MTAMLTPLPTPVDSTDLADPWDLDITIIRNPTAVAPNLTKTTDDGCGSTCESACTNSNC